MATIYYLNWDQEERGEATNFFHNISFVEQSEDIEIDEDKFNSIYREIDDVDIQNTDDSIIAQLERLWAEWNAGSQMESDEFLENEVRSMSTGDVVYVDSEEKYYVALTIGFKELKLRE